MHKSVIWCKIIISTNLPAFYMGVYNDWTAPVFYQCWLATATAPQQSDHSRYPFLDCVPPTPGPLPHPHPHTNGGFSIPAPPPADSPPSELLYNPDLSSSEQFATPPSGRGQNEQVRLAHSVPGLYNGCRCGRVVGAGGGCRGRVGGGRG